MLLIITLYLKGEFSFEDFHSKSERIFRLTMHVKSNQYDMHWARIDRDFMNELPRDFAGIEEMVRFQNYYPRDVIVGDDVFRQEHAFSTDAEIFRVFDFSLVQGDPATALVQPYSAVLTETTARKFFGNTDVLGESIQIAGNTGTDHDTYKITGIMEDLPSNTHLPVNMLTSFASENDRTGWAYTYLLLRDESYAAQLSSSMDEFILRHAGKEEAEILEFPIQNLEDIHLSGGYAREIIPAIEMRQVLLVGGIGLLVFFLTIINFMNLNAALSLKRRAEISLRKMMGAPSYSISFQFFIESLLITGLAILLALVLVNMLQPIIREVLPTTVSIYQVLPVMVAAGIFTSALASYYPSVILTRQNPNAQLTGGETLQSGRISIRTLLVGFQMVLCISMVSAAMISTNQFRYISDKDLGFDQSAMMVINSLPDPMKPKIPFIKHSISELPGVESAASVMEVPSREIRDAGPVFRRGVSWTEEEAPVFDAQVVDHDFVEIMNLRQLAGPGFSSPKTPDWRAIQEDPLKYLTTTGREYIINETAMRQLGFDEPRDAIGEMMRWEIGGIRLQDGPIVGVIGDYHQETLKNEVDPVVMFQEPYWTRHILVRIEPGATREAMASVRDFWKAEFSRYPLEIAFMDDLYQQLYEREEKQVVLVKDFTVLALIISFLGIFGLLAFVMKSREKELAIRKVLGASLTSISALVSRRFVLTALAGASVAIPITWWIMRRWLNGFAYRIDLSPLYFMAGILSIVLIFFVVVLWQAQRLSTVNPAEILRAE